MANKFQFKRTTVADRTANTTNIANSAFIDKGEFAINLTDRKVFSSDAANAIFEVGSNLTSLAVTTIVANGSSGTAGQVLSSNGTTVYWSSVGGSGTVTNIATANGLSGGPITTTGTLGVVTGSTLTVNTVGIHVNSALSITSLTLAGTANGITTLAAGNTTITGFANASVSVNSALLTVGTSFIANTLGAFHTGTVNAASLTVGSNFIANTTQVTLAAGVLLSANGGVGTAGQVLASNGATGSPYWVTAGGAAGGSNTHIQFNDSTSSNGSAGFIFNKTSNNVTVGNTVTATHFDSVSDIILKENITSISNSMHYINNMHPVSYNWISTGEKSYGFIAQDVENILPDIVHIKEDGTKTISYYQIIPFLLSALKDQQKELSEIKLLLGNLTHNKE